MPDQQRSPRDPSPDPAAAQIHQTAATARVHGQAVDTNACTAVGLVSDQNKIVWSGAHVKECLELALGQQATARNVPHGVFGDALRVQNDARLSASRPLQASCPLPAHFSASRPGLLDS